jgi:hypothetical protein
MDGGDTWVTLARLTSDTTSFEDAWLPLGNTVGYRIATLSAGTAYAIGEAAFVDTPAAPAAPIQIDAGQDFVSLAWGATADATGYVLQRQSEDGAWVGVAWLGADQLTWTDTVPPASKFNYRVVTLTASGDEWTSESAATASLPPPPSAPVGLEATRQSAGWKRRGNRRRASSSHGPCQRAKWTPSASSAASTAG